MSDKDGHPQAAYSGHAVRSFAFREKSLSSFRPELVRGGLVPEEEIEPIRTFRSTGF